MVLEDCFHLAQRDLQIWKNVSFDVLSDGVASYLPSRRSSWSKPSVASWACGWFGPASPAAPWDPVRWWEGEADTKQVRKNRKGHFMLNHPQKSEKYSQADFDLNEMALFYLRNCWVKSSEDKCCCKGNSTRTTNLQSFQWLVCILAIWPFDQ